MNLTPHQLERLRLATSGPIGILGGGPGTGKTYCVAALCESLSHSIGLDQIAIGAPTGKAAVRVTETLAGHGIHLRARTWHSLLRGGTDGGFLYTTGNPLPFRVLIGDESSMVDLDLMASIFRARAAGALFLLVGDVNQLPPVGHGAPLRDLIAAGLPYGELTELQRQAATSMIALNCKAIREGKPFIHVRIEERHRLEDVITATRVEAGENQYHIDAGSPEQQMQRLIELLRVCSSLGFDPTWQCQQLVMRNYSQVGRDAVNALLLPKADKTCDSPFRINDKVICLENCRLPLVESDDADASQDEKGLVRVANGEIGKVVHVEDRVTTVELEFPRRVVKVPRGKSNQGDDNENKSGDDDKENKTKTGCPWDHAYAVTVWKGQGSDWPVTATLIDEQAIRSGCRELIYTAGSRPKKLGVTIGKESIMRQMCKRQAIWQRKTFLKERVLLEMAKREMVGL